MMFSEGGSGRRSLTAPNLNENPLNDDENVLVMSDEDDDASFDLESSKGDKCDDYTVSLFNCTIEYFADWVRQQGGRGRIISSLLLTYQLPAETDGVVSGQLINWLH